MSSSSKHTYTMVYTKGRSSSCSCVTGKRCAFPGVDRAKHGRPARSYCGGMSYGGVQDRERCICCGLGGGPSGGGHPCAPPGRFGCGSISFEHRGDGLGISNKGPLFSCNEKMTMQNLNARLASYLDKVQSLEEENAQLECKIRKHYDQQGPLSDSKDYSSYCQQIEDLKKQIISTTVDNRKLFLDIHNKQLTADDFKMKCETELIFRQDVEVDIKSLRQVLDQLTLSRSDLETQFESLQEELCCLKKSHREEVTLLKNKATGNFNVEVNCNSGSDLQKVLDDLRRQYEAIIERNRREAEKWYESKMEEINQQVIDRSEDAEDGNNQVLDLKRQLQTLEINLQAQLSLRDTLQDSLEETQRHYNNYLGEIQNQISCVEQQLAELRAETECQNREYRKLLDAKCLLEQEIKTYHSLLEGEQLDPEQTEEDEVTSEEDEVTHMITSPQSDAKGLQDIDLEGKPLLLHAE